MISKKSKLSLMCYLSYGKVSSQEVVTDPLGNNCLDAPCTYKGECRDKNRICGDTVAHCNAQSVWVPACGGGAGLDKPLPVPLATASPPTNRPTMREEASSTPTTKWELWIKSNTATSGDEEDDGQDQADLDGGADGVTTGNGGEGDRAQSNETDTGFDPEAWNYRGEEEKGGILDQIPFLNNASMSTRRKSGVVFLVSAGWAWGFLS